MTTSAKKTTIRELGQPGDLGWVIMAHGEVYAAEFGWDASFEALVCKIVADYASGHDPLREGAWIAEIQQERVGCIFCVADPANRSTAKLRILLVHPNGRGQGLGGRLLDTSLTFAHKVGYHRVRLWTNHPLAAARHLYLARGFQLVEEEPHHSFGVHLVGQVYELHLRDGVGTNTKTTRLPPSARRGSIARYAPGLNPRDERKLAHPSA